MSSKILVLDDEKHYAQMLHDLLDQRFFDVEIATKPETALEMLEEEAYGLIISDFKMPVMDGADFLQKIRLMNPGIPVIMVSGLMSLPELIKVANMSVTVALEKPIDVKLFIDEVSKYVAPLSAEIYKDLRGDRSASASKAAPVVEKWTTHYPAVTLLTDYSLSSKVYLEKLWQALNAHKLIFFSTHVGMEVEAIALQASTWLKLKGKQPYYTEPKAFLGHLNQALIDTLNSGKDSMPVVVLQQFKSMDLSEQEAFMALFKEGLKPFKGAENIYFLCFVEFDLLAQQACLEGCKQFFAGRTIEVPPLKHRVYDMAAYVKKYLGIFAKNLPIKTRLSTDLIKDLVHYPWPGNFEQLKSTLEQLVQKGGDAPIQTREFRELLKDVRDTPPTLAMSLKESQSRVMNKALRRFHNHWKDVAFALDLKGKIPQEGTAPDSLDFMYPELL